MDSPTVDDSALASLSALWSHDGVAADRVRALKYGDRGRTVTVLADAMASRAPAVDVVTWCPATPAARRTRGFDQGELLARAVAHRLRVPVRGLLRRARGDRRQTDRDRRGRLVGPDLTARRRLRGSPRVLLIDDVTTTGTTLIAAATALRGAGAGPVHGLVATRAMRARADTCGG